MLPFVRLFELASAPPFVIGLLETGRQYDCQDEPFRDQRRPTDRYLQRRGDHEAS